MTKHGRQLIRIMSRFIPLICNVIFVGFLASNSSLESEQIKSRKKKKKKESEKALFYLAVVKRDLESPPEQYRNVNRNVVLVRFCDQLSTILLILLLYFTYSNNSFKLIVFDSSSIDQIVNKIKIPHEH